ncbi:DUF305 domain-containing protein [Gammaproteobacteria bacterium]|nr:DUF305 domain-containing protein [Gammaproteobacteria bacterium]
MKIQLFLTSILIHIMVLSSAEIASSPVIVQPGQPGSASKIIDAQTAINIADTSYTLDDVLFLQQMIPHHEQAILLSTLAPDRTNSESILDLAKRIETSQHDEILFMKDWLGSRGEDSHHIKISNEHMKMMGMATKTQIEELSALNGFSFDDLFLRLMIAHHRGAIQMVEHLKNQPGSAFDQVLNDFVSDLDNDQSVEIERMNLLLTNLSEDPRVNLSSGLFHADEAILNLTKVSSLKKPAGFYDPGNIEGDGMENLDEDQNEKRTIEEMSSNRRYPMLSFSNTDMAFKDNILVAGNYHGFNIYSLQNPETPQLLSSVICPGGQGDVSIVGDLLIMSVEESRGRVDCGLQGAGSEPTLERFRGIRIFDISNLQFPKQVGQVQTCRGSHTHSVVVSETPDRKIIVYNSGTSSVRDQEELDSCFEEIPGDNRTALFRIDIIEIPIDNPANSSIVKSPAVFADPETGVLAGLWRGGDHGDETQETSRTDQCHDITVFPSKKIAAGACSGNGILFDISDPFNPTRIDVVTDIGFAYWHSATFNNDGTKVVFTDEWGGGGRARCRAWDPLDWGANAIYDIVDRKLIFKSHYKMSAPQQETENCVAHNGSIIPIKGKDIMVQAWYQGGISVMDFTDSENPIEIAFFDRGPISDKKLITGGYWSAYYYEGNIYASEIVRGLDVFQLTPSKFLTLVLINEAKNAYPVFGQQRLFNPQQQIPMTWPAE